MGRKTVEKNISYDDVRKCYYVALYFGKDNEGKKIQTYATASSLKKARTILKDHRRKMEAGTATPPAKDTLSDCTKAFIDYKASDLAESTIYGYTNIWKNHILPYFGKKRIQEITAKDIQDYISFKNQSTLSKASIKKHIALLYSVFKNAYITGLINENPLDRMERMKAKAPQMDCMNTQEIAELCNSVKGTQLEVPVLLAAYMGLRRGEILGLKWEHIDFEKATLSIENTRTMVGKNIVEKSPKTERSTRQLHLDTPLLQLLSEHKEKFCVISDGKRKLLHPLTPECRNMTWLLEPFDFEETFADIIKDKKNEGIEVEDMNKNAPT
jgi:integrase